MSRKPTDGQRMKILVGMSGGVDSSVAAALLVKQGYDVTGGFIKNWSDTKDLWTGECAWRGERRDALRVAAKLGISLVTFDFEKEYRHRVLDRMFAEYEQGLTPNPDVLCNEEIKFGLFFDEAMKRGFDFVATGHYARIGRDRSWVSDLRRFLSRSVIPAKAGIQPMQFDVNRSHLLKGRDPDKDQSYFLHRLSQHVLQRTLFPIGDLHKKDVRKRAAEMGLSTAAKPDSQGICFVGKMDFHQFLRQRIPSVPGEIVTPAGESIGQHDGLDAYTIGQRQGLGVSRDQRAWYVAKKDFHKNHLVVVSDKNHPLLFAKKAVIHNVHWCATIPRRGWFGEAPRVSVAIRYRQEPVQARIVSLRASTCVLRFASPVHALAPGQSAVLYQGDECLGGGFLAPCDID